MKKIFLTLAIFAAIGGTSTVYAASSASFSIPTSVLGGGGGRSSSSGFHADATAGQPSPIMDQAAPPQSTNYNNYPGFWYTIGAGACGDLATFAPSFGKVAGDAGYSGACDFDTDGDVDGVDLQEFISNI